MNTLLTNKKLSDRKVASFERQFGPTKIVLIDLLKDREYHKDSQSFAKQVLKYAREVGATHIYFQTKSLSLTIWTNVYASKLIEHSIMLSPEATNSRQLGWQREKLTNKEIQQRMSEVISDIRQELKTKIICVQPTTSGKWTRIFE